MFFPFGKTRAREKFFAKTEKNNPPGGFPRTLCYGNMLLNHSAPAEAEHLKKKEKLDMKKMWKRAAAVLLCGAMTLGLLTSCGGGETAANSASSAQAAQTSEGLDKKDTLIYGAEFMDDTLNPMLDSQYCGSMLYRGLMKTDENCKPQYDIATDCKISDDLLEYTFTIRDDVTFHDGTKLTVEDVVFTLNTIMDEKTNSALREDFTEVETVEKVDDTTLKITLKTPFPALLDKLTVGIVPAHCFAEGEDVNTADFNQNPVGCGPYRFVSYEEDSKLVMTRFDGYYGDQAKIKNIVFTYLPDYNVRALQLSTGEIDLAYVEPSQAEELDQGENTTVYKIDTADYRCVMFNFAATDLFDDVKVRQALCYNTDRESVVRSILHGYGEAAYTPLQRNEFKNENVARYDYDAEQAAALLDEAGWTDHDGDGIRDKDGKKLSFTLTAPVTDEVRVNIATYLVEEWKKLGVDCKVDALDWNAIDISQCEAFILGWGSPFDADNDTYRLFATDGSVNYGSYSNGTVDETLRQARTTSNQDERGAAYRDFQQALAEDPAYDFICYLTALYGANNRVSGISTEKTLGHHGAGIFWNIETWELT